MRTTVVALAALALAQAASTAHAAHGFEKAYRATGVTTLCFTQNEWSHVLARWPGRDNAMGLYFDQSQTIALAPGICEDLTHWRHADPYNVLGSLWVLGHEWAHQRQQAAGKPFDDCKADAWGWRRINYLRRALGITKRLPHIPQPPPEAKGEACLDR